ncbi:MAG: class I SAM-dependent methyltransferase [Paracoccaceae bacterium]|nr:class I SAM-dependent methyltransferase [Paracoccaceae bacterium]
MQEVVRKSGSARVLDLGCGAGDLLVRLAIEPALVELVGIDICRASLDRLRDRLGTGKPSVLDIDLREASMTHPTPDLAGFDCAILIETIEHIDPDELSKLECAVFQIMRPKTLVITPPNSEFNPLLGVPSCRMRHPGHRFEWDRAQFRRWSAWVAAVRASTFLCVSTS